MEFASRLVSVLLGIVVMVFVLWPITIPVGFGEAWWASRQAQSRVESRAPSQSAPGPEVKPATPPPPPEAAAPAPSPQAAAPSATDGKPGRPVREKAEAERLAALKEKDATGAEADKTGAEKEMTGALAPGTAAKRYYRVTVRDAGTLVSGGVVIKLAGIAARDPDATCKGKDGKAWRCGAAAKTALARLIQARAVTCAVPKSGNQKSGNQKKAGAQKELAARCDVSGIDLSTWLVRQGWADPQEPPEPALAEAAKAAQAERAGIWRGAD